MMKRLSFIFLTLSLALSAGQAIAQDDPEIFEDLVGDAVIRRTDAGADGVINANSNLPDIKEVAVGSWFSPTPSSNPFSGFWGDDGESNLFRIDLAFDGLLNPPGPNGLSGPRYDPYQYGPSPVYGFLEIDLDDNLDTGGEVNFVANRYLGNAARFGGMSDEDIGERAARHGTDLDDDLLTPPFVERSGEEVHFSLCGCDEYLVLEDFGDATPNTFDAGDQWILLGRFLHRTHSCSEYSFSFGGSSPGEYDPLIMLLFVHDEKADETIISFVYALNQAGAAELAGEMEQDIDLNAGNHTSIHEMLFETWFTAVNGNDPGNGTAFDLIRDWADLDAEDLDDFLQPSDWDINVIFGTAYQEQETDAFYIWTDVGFDIRVGDLNGDEDVDTEDQDLLMSHVAEYDAGNDDADQFLNGQLLIGNFGVNFSIYDVNYDGAINAIDLIPLGYWFPGDVNIDRHRDNADLLMVQSLIGTDQDDPEYNPAADLTRDGRITNADLRLLWRLINADPRQVGGG